MNTEKPQNLLAAFHHWLQAVPEANAWVDAQQSLSYRELEDKSSVLAAKSAVLVGKPGDIIVLYLQKRCQYGDSHIGGSKAWNQLSLR